MNFKSLLYNASIATLCLFSLWPAHVSATESATITSQTPSIVYSSQFEEYTNAYVNCGPAVLKMVVQSFGDSPEYASLTLSDIRETLQPKELGLYVSEFEEGLKAYDIPYTTEAYDNLSSLTDLLDSDKTLAVCLNMEPISYKNGGTIGKNTAHLNNGHYLLITDYTVQDDTLLFDVIDPYNPKIGMTYMFEPESTYLGDELHLAISSWSPLLFAF